MFGKRGLRLGLVLFLLILSITFIDAAVLVAELPRETVDTTYVLPTGAVIQVNAGGDL